jgi:hypothetical protein
MAEPPDHRAALWANLDSAYRRFFAYVIAAQYDLADKELELISELAAALRSRQELVNT